MTNNTEILRTEGLKRSYLVNETKIDVLKGINLTVKSAGPADGRKSLF